MKTSTRMSLLNRWFRKSHRYISLVIALPILITVSTGVVLMMRGQFSYIQPTNLKGSQPLIAPRVSIETVLQVLQRTPQSEVTSWNDVDSLIFSPAKGTYQARLANDYLVQIDAQTGDTLDVSYRRTNLLIALHQGSFFHKKVMLWIFFPSGLGLLFLWISGMYLSIYPQVKRKKKNVK
jgi:hypothetical protein